MEIPPAELSQECLTCPAREAAGPHVDRRDAAEDFLTIDGWTIDYLGANVPADDLAKLVARRRPVLVALSVTQTHRLPAVALAASAIRKLGSSAPVLAAGAALRGLAGAAATLGVAAVALDARTYLSGLERGKQNPTIGALLRLATALETPLDRLVASREPPPRR